ncbi:MAG: helix-turn-helix domain-containing protein [Methanoregula sp.]|nr:helix-turn-helix domain-containing protein [Methanoregula sp.]
MDYVTRSGSIVLLTILLLICIPVVEAQSPDPPDSSITYTITVYEDGTAFWHVEYRTLLVSDEDMAMFDAYAGNVSSIYLPQFEGLMQRSAAQAAAATSRLMDVTDFAGNGVVQTSPTGRYGVVFYSFSWKGFAKTGNDLTVGDALAGGLYLAKDNTLIVRYPAGYTVSSAEPAPDEMRDGLIWYGQRSFGPGEPRLVFEKTGFPWLPVVLGCVLILIIFAGLYVINAKRHREKPDDPDIPAVQISEAELITLEEKIIQLLKASGGEQFQSEIVKNLGLPKSTVSATLNDLHRRGMIQKVKKGRENLIRLI